MPGPLLFVLDVALLGIALLVFATFHHVLPSRQEAVGITSTRGGVATPAPDAAEPTPAPTDAPDRVSTLPDMPVVADQPVAADEAELSGYFGNKYADKFVSGAPVYTQTADGFTYVSENVNLTFTRYNTNGVVFYVADFYVRDITNYRTAFANDAYGKGQRESVPSMSSRLSALIAVNGDYYGTRSDGIIIRNGTLYRNEQSGNDVCVLYWDGTMRTFGPREVTGEALMEQGAYQSWDFGPALLDEYGQPKTSFNSTVGPKNPRTALGYYEPGHYCIVVVDGRSSESAGLGLTNLSELMYNLGCVAAYNLDGGQSSVMTWQGSVINVPYNGGRKSSDCVYIGE